MAKPAEAYHVCPHKDKAQVLKSLGLDVVKVSHSRTRLVCAMCRKEIGVWDSGRNTDPMYGH